MLGDRYRASAAALRSLSAPEALAIGEARDPDVFSRHLSEESHGVKPLRLHAQIARDLAIAIVSGAYKPGERLFGEIASSERLNVSRTVYREAVRILVAKGLVSSRPKAGTIVNAQSLWHLLDPELLGWAFEKEPDSSLLESLYELRGIVEPRAAAFAAERRSEVQLYAIRDCVERMAKATLRTEEGRTADRDFHVAVLAATGNSYIASLATSLGAAICATAFYLHGTERAQLDTVPDHRRVYEAIAGRDSDRAEVEMRALIRQAFLNIAGPSDRRGLGKTGCSGAPRAA